MKRTQKYNVEYNVFAYETIWSLFICFAFYFFM